MLQTQGTFSPAWDSQSVTERKLELSKFRLEKEKKKERREREREEPQMGNERVCGAAAVVPRRRRSQLLVTSTQVRPQL